MTATQAIAELNRVVRKFIEDGEAALARLAVATANANAEAFANRALAQMDGNRLPPAHLPLSGGPRSLWYQTTGRHIEAANDRKGQ